MLIVLSLSVLSAQAMEKDEVREKWHTPYDLYLSAREAYDMKQANPDTVMLIDVRTREEVMLTGWTDMSDANIPVYMLSEEWKQKKDSDYGSFRKRYNPDFVAAVDNFLASRNADRSTPLILMCQSGGRSPIAARILHDAGFEKVWFQVEGFEGIKAKSGADKGKRVVNGWKNAGLPWGYKLKKDKMYFNFAPE